ncbi:hypothetical protein DUHN55_31830 [Helicobacter pylori]
MVEQQLAGGRSVLARGGQGVGEHLDVLGARVRRGHGPVSLATGVVPGSEAVHRGRAPPLPDPLWGVHVTRVIGATLVVSGTTRSRDT